MTHSHVFNSQFKTADEQIKYNKGNVYRNRKRLCHLLETCDYTYAQRLVCLLERLYKPETPWRNQTPASTVVGSNFTSAPPGCSYLLWLKILVRVLQH